MRSVFIRTLIAAVLVCAGTMPLYASTSDPPEVRVTYTEAQITIDGALDEPPWQQAEVTDSLRQREPTEGAPASERTEVRVLYSRARLYIGVICFDSQPEAIVTSRYDRDADLGADDRISVLFDTFSIVVTLLHFKSILLVHGSIGSLLMKGKTVISIGMVFGMRGRGVLRRDGLQRSRFRFRR